MLHHTYRWVPAAVIVAALAGGRPASNAQTVDRSDAAVVAIGDIHGAYTEFVGLLSHLSLIDSQQRWSGGRTTVVQTGDFTDRGHEVRRVMELLMTLESEAEAAGGQFIVLLGNHETMNLTNFLRDVSPEAFASFADGRSDGRRLAAYVRYSEFLAARAGELGATLPVSDLETWMQDHPPGWIEYVEAFGPEGRYGRWLREKRSITRIGDTMFLHGGLHPDDTASSVDDINRRTWGELRQWDEAIQRLIERGVVLPFFTFDEMLDAVSRELDAWVIRLWPGPPDSRRSAPPVSLDDREHIQTLVALLDVGKWSIVRPDGPFWFRGYAEWTEQEGMPRIQSVLARHRANRVVVGHTIPESFRITARLAGQVLLIDTGMLSAAYPGGRPSALRITNDELVAEYLDSRVTLLERKTAR